MFATVGDWALVCILDILLVDLTVSDGVLVEIFLSLLGVAVTEVISCLFNFLLAL